MGKLHPTAVDAAREMGHGMIMAAVFHKVIEDHLKSAGWLELREAADDIASPSREDGADSMLTWHRLQNRLCRVRGDTNG